MNPPAALTAHTPDPRVAPPARRSLRTRLWEVVVDANPVIAKELLATARTPLYLWSIVMTPLILGIIVLLFARDASPTTIDPDAGEKLYSVYFWILTFVLGVAGASLGATVLVQEHESGALQALRFSSLRPRQIVLGKFVAVVLALVAVAVCTLPLLAYVLSMGGVPLAECGSAMAIALTTGALTASLGIAVSARSSQTRRSLIVSLVGGGAIGIGVMVWLGIGSGLIRDWSMFATAKAYIRAPFDAGYIGELILLPGYSIAVIFGFGYAAATSGLMDTSEDRSRPIKRWALGVLFGGLLVAAMAAALSDRVDDARDGFASLGTVFTTLLGALLLFAFAGEPVAPTRRMKAHPAAFLSRVLTPGCLEPSLVFVVVASAVTMFGFLGMRAEAREAVSFPHEVAFLWSTLALTTLAGLLGGVAARSNAAKARKVAVFTIVGLVLAFALLRDNGWHPSMVDVICPVWIELDEVVARSTASAIMNASLVAWGAAAVGSLVFMRRSVRARASAKSGTIASGG